MESQDRQESQKTQVKDKSANRVPVVLVALHVLLLFYSCSGFTSKFAAQQPVASTGFFVWYGVMLAILAVYALGWQQILKRLPLTVAFANKSITVVWGIVWGVLLFHETVTPLMIVGGLTVIAGIVLFSIADGEERASREGAAGAGMPEEGRR